MNVLDAFLVLLISWGVAFKVFFKKNLKKPILVVDHKKIV